MDTAATTTEATKLKGRKFARNLNLRIDVEIAEAQNFINGLFDNRDHLYDNVYVYRTPDNKIRITNVMENGLIIHVDYDKFDCQSFRDDCMTLFS